MRTPICDRLGCEVAAIPSAGLDPELFVARTAADERPIDIGYRAYDSPVYLGHDERAQLARCFTEAAACHGLRADISLDPADRFDEAGWAAFLDRCRGQLGSEAGADFFELTDETRTRVWEWVEQNAGATGEDVLQKFFSEPLAAVSGRALSGRVVEAAGTKTVQLLLEGEYGGYFRPGEHYIAVDKDFGNVEEALAAFDDRAHSARLAEAAYEVAAAELTYERLIDRFHAALAGVL